MTSWPPIKKSVPKTIATLVAVVGFWDDSNGDDTSDAIMSGFLGGTLDKTFHSFNDLLGVVVVVEVFPAVRIGFENDTQGDFTGCAFIENNQVDSLHWIAVGNKEMDRELIPSLSLIVARRKLSLLGNVADYAPVIGLPEPRELALLPQVHQSAHRPGNLELRVSRALTYDRNKLMR